MKTFKRLFYALLSAALCVVACVPAQAVAEGKGVCYRVSGGRNELFLLGSIHIGSESMYPVCDEIADALSASDVLVLECDTENPSVVAQINAMMRYSDDDQLSDHLSAETYELLRQVCDQTGYSLAMMDRLRPWAVVSVFSLKSTAAEMGVADVSHAVALGVETQICALAGDKRRAYLETAVDQLAVLDGFSPELQEYLLQTVLRTILEPERYTQPGDADIAKWADWWQTGDADAFAASYLSGLEVDPEPELAREYHAGLVSKRNQTMAQGLQRLMESDEPHRYFAVVGLLHLALPNDSILSNLREMGYTVQKVGE